MIISRSGDEVESLRPAAKAAWVQDSRTDLTGPDVLGSFARISAFYLRTISQ